MKLHWTIADEEEGSLYLMGAGRETVYGHVWEYHDGEWRCSPYPEAVYPDRQEAVRAALDWLEAFGYAHYEPFCYHWKGEAP